jgi:S-adenosylmethionine/arginine decarboxylase-like enzyme
MIVTSHPTRHALYFDAVVKRGGLLASSSFLEEAARACADVAGMRILSMEVHDVALDLAKLNCKTFEDEGGKTLHALLSTSHLSIHGWPHRSIFMFDLVSCRRFDQAQVEAIVRERFNVQLVLHKETTDVVWPTPGVGFARRAFDPVDDRDPHHSQR